MDEKKRLTGQQHANLPLTAQVVRVNSGPPIERFGRVADFFRARRLLSRGPRFEFWHAQWMNFEVESVCFERGSLFTFYPSPFKLLDSLGGVAQLGERCLCKADVVGSSPSTSMNKSQS